MDCALPEVSFGDSSAKFEPNSYLDPWRLGLETLSLFGLQAGSVGLFRTSWWAKGALLEFILSPKATTPGPWKNQHLATQIQQKKEASRSPVSPLRAINIWNFLFTCSSCLFWKGNWEVGIVWPNIGWPRYHSGWPC